MKDDTISRQAVLKLLAAMPPEEAMTKSLLIQSVKQMSAAQPEKRTEERTEKHACDCISRKAAIDAIVNTVSEIGLHDNSEVARYGATFRQHEIIDIIEGMPSAHPEIIRCRDCYYRLGRYCHYRYTTGLFISADHYCGFAKRQEDNK